MDTQLQLTPKEQEIPYLLYRFRFLTTYQFQHLFNHSSPSQVKEWLKKLTQQHYIYSNYKRTYGENTKPAVFCLDRKSIQLLKNHSKCEPSILKRIYAEKTRSLQFQNHSLFITNLYLQLKKETEKQKTLHFSTKEDLRNYASFPETLPDAYIAIKDPEKRTQRYFIHVFDQGEPFYAIQAIVDQLVNYVKECKWQEVSHDPLPSILFIFTGEKLKDSIYRYIIKTLKNSPEVKLSFFVGIKLIIQAEGLHPGLWKKVEVKKD